MPTKLELIADRERVTLEAKNTYNTEGRQYGSSNSNALSDGDEKGKGQVGDTGSIGSKTDIQTRLDNIVKNDYKETNQYSSSNRDAQSDGDVFGKGQIDDTGTIGSIVDINERIKLLGKNSYKQTNQYSASNKNALSDGDEKGKGQIEGNGDPYTAGGSSLDISKRNSLTVSNTYYPDRQYGTGVSRSISDGDEFGKGQADGNGDPYTAGGSSVDISKRTVLTGKNFFKKTNPYYPTIDNE